MKIRYILLSGLLLVAQLASAQVVNPDSVILDEYDSVFVRPKEVKHGRNEAKNDSVDISRFQMENRYRFSGNTFPKRFLDRAYFSVGIGVKRIIPMQGGLGLRPLTQMSISGGYQFDRCNSLRAGFDYATGYQQSSEYQDNLANQFTQVGMHLDYLFDWSAYTRDYNPRRRFSLSTILGFDGNVNFFKTTGTRWGYGGRFGLQLRFHTGNRSYVDVEPYVGIGSDNLRLNINNAAWRRVQILYGVNVNLTFFLHDILQDSKTDTTTYCRAPFFFEYGVGPLFTFDKGDTWSNSTGHVSQISVGKWLAPPIGLRLSYSISQTQWGVTTNTVDEDLRNRSNTTTYHTMHSGFGFEVLVNPLGFKKGYDFNKLPAGFHLVVGAGGIGWLNKYTTDHQTALTTTVSAGLHVWKKITDDVQCFIEPKYIYRNYHKGFVDSDEASVFSQNNMSLAIGITVNSRPRKYRKFPPRIEPERVNPEEFLKKDTATIIAEWKAKVAEQNKVHHWRVGLGVGMPLSIDKFSYDEGMNGFSWCAQGYGVYDFNHIHGIRLNVDFSSHNNYTINRYSLPDIANMQVGDELTFLMNRRNLIGSMMGLSYNIDLTNAMCGFLPYGFNKGERRWHVDLYAGPALSMSFQTDAIVTAKCVPITDENGNQIGRTVTSSSVHENHVNIHPGGLIGMSLLFDCTKHIGVYLSPTFYILSEDEELKGSSVGGLHLTQNINVGVQYKF